MPKLAPIPGQLSALFVAGTTRDEAKALLEGHVFNFDMIAWVGNQTAVFRVRPGYEQQAANMVEHHRLVVAVTQMYQEVDV